MSKATAQISHQAREELTFDQALQEIDSLKKTIEIHKQYRGDFVQASQDNQDRARCLEQSNRTLLLAVDLTATRDQEVAELLADIIAEAHSRNFGPILTLATAALRRLA